MTKAFKFLSVVLTLMLFAGSMAAAEPAKDGTPNENTSSEGGNVTNLQYIWQLNLDEKDMIKMVLNQSGETLVGQARPWAEDAPAWNAQVIGSLSGKKVELTMIAMKGTEMVTTKLNGIVNGTAEDPVLEGTFKQINGQGATVQSGNFTAAWWDTNTGAYTPAVVNSPTTAAQKPSDQPTAEVGNNTTNEPILLSKTGASRFVDVRKYAQQVTPAGVIPPGMGMT